MLYFKAESVLNEGFGMKKDVLQTQERGATLLEVFGVLAILSVITVGALSGYTKVMEMYSGAKGVTETRRILKDIDSYCAFERPCKITTEKAHKLKIIADEYYDSSTKTASFTFTLLLSQALTVRARARCSV